MTFLEEHIEWPPKYRLHYITMSAQDLQTSDPLYGLSVAWNKITPSNQVSLLYTMKIDIDGARLSDIANVLKNGGLDVSNEDESIALTYMTKYMNSMYEKTRRYPYDDTVLQMIEED